MKVKRSLAALLSVSIVCCFTPTMAQAALVVEDEEVDIITVSEDIATVSENLQVANVEDVEDIGDVGDVDDIVDIGGTENPEDIDDIVDIGDIEDAEDTVSENDLSSSFNSSATLEAEADTDAEADWSGCEIEIIGNAAATIAESSIEAINRQLYANVSFGETSKLKIEVNEVSTESYDGTAIKEDLATAFTGATVPFEESYLTISITQDITDSEGNTRTTSINDLGTVIDIIYTPTGGNANLRAMVHEDATERSHVIATNFIPIDLPDGMFFADENGDVHIFVHSVGTFAFGYAEGVYEVWFYNDGGVEDYDPIYTNVLGELPTPNSIEGWDFLGWFYENNVEANTGDTLTEDVILTSDWDYEVDFAITKGYDFIVTPNEDGVNTVTLVEGYCSGKKLNINTVKIGKKTYKITRIYNNAFEDDENLKELVIGPNVKKINDAAFSGCMSLKKVVIGNGVEVIGEEAFAFCYGLKYAKIGNGVKTISPRAFYGDGVMEKLVIGSGLQTIGEEAFAWCPGITNLSINMETIPDMMFAGCELTKLTIGPNVKTIGYGAFSSCEILKSVDLNKVQNIEESAFAGCLELKKVKFGKSIQTIGDEAFYYTAISGELKISNATLIDEDAFSDCYKIKSLKLGNGVKNVGYGAFYGCSNLKTITIGSGVESISENAFDNCNGLTTVKVNMKEIPAKMFMGCDSIKTLVLGPNVKTIGDQAFEGCTKLKIKSLKNVTTLGWCAFSGTDLTEITVNADLIDMYAFEGCTKLKTAKLGKSVKKLDYGAFANCENLKTITIGSGVESIDTDAFMECNKLSTVKINMAEIEGEAFRRKPSLTKVVLGSKVKKVGDFAFEGCEKLKKVEFGKRLESIGEMAFANSGITSASFDGDVGKCAFYECYGLKTVAMGKNTHNIGDEAFYNCEGLKSVKMGGNVGAIGNSAFYGCDGLGKINITNSVNSIGDFAFAHCYKLKTATIGTGVNHIGEYAFMANGRLGNMNIKSSHLTELDSVGENFLDRIKPNATIRMPKAVFEKMKTVFMSKGGGGNLLRYRYLKEKKK